MIGPAILTTLSPGSLLAPRFFSLAAIPAGRLSLLTSFFASTSSAAHMFSRASILADVGDGPASNPIPAILILGLCVVAGIATLMLLPSSREPQGRSIGGVVLGFVGLIFVAALLHYLGAGDRSGVGIYFWIFAAIAIVGAVRVVTHPRPVYSALYFVMTVFATAGLFILLWAQFMAAALVLIYAGAILITYVFVIMLASQAQASGTKGNPLAGLASYDTTSREPFVASCVGFVLMGVLLLVIFDKGEGLHHAYELGSNQAVEPTNTPEGSTQALGYYLFHNQLINVELAGLILTLATVGAIVIARKKVEDPDMPPEPSTDVVLGPSTPIDDDPHSIPVLGTSNPRQKAYPEH
jgi:NADH-quinone oxidoreductase subunit J